ncbi:MAG TPA: carbohydrate-binding protein [Polyangiaceae bacterium]|nr:carbohydrate-binding protein [Polyangiaceae bacterium]
MKLGIVSGAVIAAFGGALVLGCSAATADETLDWEDVAQSKLALAAPGSVTFEQWFAVPGTAVSAIPVSTPPSSSGTLTQFETPASSRNDYGVRVRGSLIAPTTGSYTFWIASDDNGELSLGTDATAASKRRIAHHTSWTNSREWNKFATQKSAPVNLVAGQRYYIEALMKDGSGADHLAVGWLRPGQSGNVPSEIIPGAQLTPYEAPPAGTATYEAEQAAIFDSVIETVNAGYTGSGYVNANARAGSYVQWNVSASAAGQASVSIRYANGTTSARRGELRLNGTVINPSLSFPGTGSWATWNTVVVSVTLRAGSNELRLTGIDAVSLPNVDRIDVTAGSSPAADRDHDGLADSVETNTGVFRGTSNTGTNPDLADTDGDALSDGDETLGTSAGLNLPAMGTNPLRKNILIEHDWFEDARGCAAHSHRPNPTVVQAVSAVFAASPVRNPDGTTGVTIIHDYGQGGAFTGGNRVPDADGVLTDPEPPGPEMRAHRANHFAANRQGYFHYNLHVHHYNTDSPSSGYADIIGDDLVVSLGCDWQSDSFVTNTIIHELGHNLGLRHGGAEDLNNKPNYNSLMNYRFQFWGVDTNCDSFSDGRADYSHGRNITLNESSLNEAAGVCGNVPIDWNFSGSIQSRVAYEINQDHFLTTLTDYNDWSNLVFVGGPFSTLATPAIARCPGPDGRL